MPLLLGLHSTFLSDINRHNSGPSALRWDARGNTLTLNPPLSLEKSAPCVRTVQRPGWDRLHWEFTVSERAVRQTLATRLCSSDGVSIAHHPLTHKRGCRRGASSSWWWGTKIQIQQHMERLLSGSNLFGQGPPPPYFWYFWSNRVSLKWCGALYWKIPELKWNCLLQWSQCLIYFINVNIFL